MPPKVFPALRLALLLPAMAAMASAFGNEYVHIKVHVPKDQAPSIAIDAEQPTQHKVIHHYHHHAAPHLRLRARPPSKPKTSPLLESVILSDLDKPLHMSEHADYLNHAKELAEQLSETYVIKKPPPPPPPPLPPKKKVNTYTIIEEKHRPHSYEYESRPEHGHVDTYRLQHHHHKHQHHQYAEDDTDDDVGYHYPGPVHQHRHKGSATLYHGGGYAEPAPVEEPMDLDLGYGYSPPAYAHGRPPAHTLEAPEESSLDSPHPYDFGSRSATSSSSTSSSSFRPSQQLSTQPDAYEDEIDSYAAPIQSRRRRPGPVDWPSQRGYISAAAEDSYNAGHGSAGYQYSGPYL
ncbi:uncharacterized protein [Drosophila virilis]|uniref:Uncharacterized protein n=1 Tax=Drosophila virilis TaxID=7244 RepID=B4M1Q9_DROVI|nr:uncharacterized protein LOC6631670 [Drosophila virilis]EDW65613.1 uncharacterized protein Dvir_GJ19355 [Drosophila virilis]